ncbi:MAG TPA: hypothetical protein VHM20_00245 [Gammaproteobacteria bacterium]|jgi:hypothetical protein|nr:hypothetical protein [Gammaproteobacteria bacterium]
MHNRKCDRANPWTILNPTPLSQTTKNIGKNLSLLAGATYLYFSPKQRAAPISQNALLFLTIGVLGASWGFFSGKVVENHQKKAKKQRLTY